MNRVSGEEDQESSSRRLGLRIGFWIAVAAVIAFLPAIGCDFVNMDDNRNFVGNQALNYAVCKKLAWAWTTCWLGVYQPLSWVLIFLEFALWSLHPGGYHAVSLGLHAMTCVALFAAAWILLDRARRGRPGRNSRAELLGVGLATLLYGVHPLRTEAVVWLSAQPYLPSVLCMLLGIAAYVKAFDGEIPWSTRRIYLAGGYLLGAAAMLFKAVAVTYPLLLLVLDAHPLGRFRQDGTRICACWRWATILAEKLPLLIFSLVMMYLAYRAKNYPQFDSGEPVAAPLSARLADAAYGLWFYPAKTMLPIGLTIVYPREEDRWVRLTQPGFAACAAGVLAVSLLAWRERRRWPAFAAAWVAYLIILAPNSGLVRYSPQLAADRYSYAASLPWVPVLAFLLVRLLGCRPAIRIASAGLAVTAALVLCCLSWYQCATWRHSVALWDHALQVGSDRSLEAHGNLALALTQVGFDDDAMVQYQAAVRIAPRSAKAHLYLAEALARQGNDIEAIRTMRRGVDFAPDLPKMHHHLASLLLLLHHPDLAEDPLRRALELDPYLAEAHRDLGVILALQGKTYEARSHLVKALKLCPEDRTARSNLENFFAEQKRGRQSAADRAAPIAADHSCTSS